jgi:homoserine O-succinyltransferase/O-acetyltransferase
MNIEPRTSSETALPHRARAQRADREFVDIGLVNNMPDAALDATERQFRALLEAAAAGIDVRLTLYTLPEVPRTEFGR